MWPVVAADHPLADEPRPVTREALARPCPTVLTDRTPLTAGSAGMWWASGSGGSPISAAAWPFCWRGSAGATCRSTWCAGRWLDGRLRVFGAGRGRRQDFSFAIHVVHPHDRPAGAGGAVAGAGFAGSGWASVRPYERRAMPMRTPRSPGSATGSDPLIWQSAEYAKDVQNALRRLPWRFVMPTRNVVLTDHHATPDRVAWSCTRAGTRERPARSCAKASADRGSGTA